MSIWIKFLIGSILIIGGGYVSIILGENGHPIFGFVILGISLMGIGGYLYIQALQEDEE